MKGDGWGHNQRQSPAINLGVKNISAAFKWCGWMEPICHVCTLPGSTIPINSVAGDLVSPMDTQSPTTPRGSARQSHTHARAHTHTVVVCV